MLRRALGKVELPDLKELKYVVRVVKKEYFFEILVLKQGFAKYLLLL